MKNKEYKKKPPYKAGWKDACIEIKLGFSPWYLDSLVYARGFARKSKDSYPKLWAYCEGFNDRIDLLFERRGLTRGEQREIGR